MLDNKVSDNIECKADRIVSGLFRDAWVILILLVILGYKTIELGKLL